MLEPPTDDARELLPPEAEAPVLLPPEEEDDDDVLSDGSTVPRNGNRNSHPPSTNVALATNT